MEPSSSARKRNLMFTSKSSKKSEGYPHAMINHVIFYRPPMWMLVNSTIFNEIDETQVMVEALIDLMKGLKVQFCGVEEGDPPRDLGEEGPNCQWEEYQQTKEYLDKVQWLSLLLMNLFIFYIVD